MTKGKTLFVLDAMNNRIISNNLTNTNSLPIGISNISTNISTPTCLYIAGNYAYVTNAGSNNLSIYDVSRPLAMVAKGTINTGLNSPQGVFVQGNLAFVTSAGNNTIAIFDISNPSAPVAKGTLTTNLSNPQGLFVYDNVIYVASQGNSKLCTFSFSPDGSTITALSSIATSLSTPVQVYVSGVTEYVADTTNGLVTFRISNPASMTRLSSVNTPFTGLKQVIVQGNLLYGLATDGVNLYQFDIQLAPYTQLSSGSYSLPVNGFALSGNNIYSYGAGIVVYSTGSSIRTSSITSGTTQTGSLDVIDGATVNNFLTVNGGVNVGGNALVNGNFSTGGNIIAGGATSTVRLKGYTVATLPAGVQGDTAFVTDALAPTFLAAVAGGGAVVAPVFYNGTTWVGY